MKTQTNTFADKQDNYTAGKDQTPNTGFVSAYLNYLKRTGKWWIALSILMAFFLGILAIVGHTNNTRFFYGLL